MPYTNSPTTQTADDMLSSILNCICPGCGGSMGTPGREFKCQGRCQTDWRAFWDSLVTTRPQSKRRLAS
jgi:hypothetical protein